MPKRALPETVRVKLNDMLEEANFAAKRAQSADQRYKLYRLKDLTLSAAIQTMSAENLELKYDLLGNGYPSVLVTIHEIRSKSLHVPFNRLLPGAKAEVWNRIGGPAQFLRDYRNSVALLGT